MIKRWVVINGDDFGLSSAVNQGIIQAYQHGILTSTSLMVSGQAATEAIAFAQTHSSLAVGLHLVLVCGKSVLSPAEIPHLVDQDGNFRNDPLKAGLIYYFNPQARQELHREIRAQLEKFRQTGLFLSHVDGHLHLQVHPVVLKILCELAQEFQISVIRLPNEELPFTLKLDPSHWGQKIMGWGVFRCLRQINEPLLRAHQIQTPERVYGLLQTGNLTETYLLELIPQIKANFVEIYAHPCKNFPEQPENPELSALLSVAVRDCLKEHGFELITYPHVEQGNCDRLFESFDGRLIQNLKSKI